MKRSFFYVPGRSLCKSPCAQSTVERKDPSVCRYRKALGQPLLLKTKGFNGDYERDFPSRGERSEGEEENGGQEGDITQKLK